VKGLSEPLLISKENEDIYAIMDLNGDGQVSSGELDAFHALYDLNGDGCLDDYELKEAADK